MQGKLSWITAFRVMSQDALMCRAWQGELSLQGVLAVISIEQKLAGNSGLPMAATFVNEELWKDSVWTVEQHEIVMVYTSITRVTLQSSHWIVPEFSMSLPGLGYV